MPSVSKLQATQREGPDEARPGRVDPPLDQGRGGE